MSKIVVFGGSGATTNSGNGEALREYINAKEGSKLSIDIIESDDYLSEHLVLIEVEHLKHKDLYRMIQDILNDSSDIKFSKKPCEGPDANGWVINECPPDSTEKFRETLTAIEEILSE